MGWIVGIFGDFQEEDINKIVSVSSDNANTLSSSNIFIRYSTQKDTIYLNTSETEKMGWIVSGVGIAFNEDRFSFLGINEWERIQHDPLKYISKLDGHFLFIKWNQDGIEFFTDQIGFRSLYLYKGNNFLMFSTRLDWLSHLSTSKTIDMKTFGSQWFLLNKLSIKSPVEGIHRICQGGYSKYDRKTFIFKNKPWEPGFVNDIGGESIESLLRKITIFPVKEEKKLSLGLSGGIDSRALFSILLSTQKHTDFEAHSLHSPDDPDKWLAGKICSYYNIPCKFYEDFITDINSTVDIISNIIGQTGPVSPISSAMARNFYQKFKNKIIIDGGLGEIVRRRYLNNLYYNGKNAIFTKNPVQIKQYLLQYRAKIFNKDTRTVMEEGIIDQIEELITGLPEISDIGLRNWIDLMAIRTRFPNLAGPEQSRIDNEVVSYMPFAQPSILRKYLLTNRLKSFNNSWINGLFRNNPELKSFPLAKDGITYPFTTNILLSSVLIKMKTKFGTRYQSDYNVRVLDSISEFVKDLVNSNSTKNCTLYDYDYIKKMVDNYYGGMKQFASRLDWWLAFEIWKNRISL